MLLSFCICSFIRGVQGELAKKGAACQKLGKDDQGLFQGFAGAISVGAGAQCTTVPVDAMKKVLPNTLQSIRPLQTPVAAARGELIQRSE